MKKIELLENDAAKDEIFLELLYDERVSEDSFLVPKEAFFEVGGINSRIKAKQNYELLLRLAERYCLKIEDCAEEEADSEAYVRMDFSAKGSVMDGFCTDCYIISRYKDKLMEQDCFNEVIQSVLAAAAEAGVWEEVVNFLEKMLSRKEDYFYMDDATRSILIYTGEETCYNVLNIFARQFGDALMRAGEKVEYFNLKQEDVKLLANCMGKRYRAIIGVQTYIFGLMINAQEDYFLHDNISGPIFNFTFDHPIWLKRHLEKFPKRMRILTIDESYVKFIAHYFGEKTYLFPPAGMTAKLTCLPKKYDISFIGSYGNYWAEVLLIHETDRKYRFLANRLLLVMRKDPDLMAEEAFFKVLDFYGIECGDEAFLELFYRMRRVIYCVRHYYRCRILECLLESGLRIHVFGENWKNAPFFGHPGLICHPNVTMEESMEIFQQSRLSLNIMSWHKGGFTERMANIMLSKAVLVTDDTSYLDGKYSHGEDLLIFYLKEFERLPDLLKEYLEKPQELERIAENGYRKTKQSHTWDERAREFLEEILEEEVCKRN